MPIFFFSSEQGREAAAALAASQREIAASIERLTQVIQGLGSTASSPWSAAFLDQYERWRGAMLRELGVLADLQSRLEQETAEWEETASLLPGEPSTDFPDEDEDEKPKPDVAVGD